MNVFGSTVGDYLEVIRQLNDAEGIAAYELNASCPNTNHGGMAFGTDPMHARRVGLALEADRQPPPHR